MHWLRRLLGHKERGRSVRPGYPYIGPSVPPCWDCGGSEFLLGPEGGMSQNVKCVKCGAEYNVMGPLGAHRIHWKEK